MQLALQWGADRGQRRSSTSEPTLDHSADRGQKMWPYLHIHNTCCLTGLIEDRRRIHISLTTLAKVHLLQQISP